MNAAYKYDILGHHNDYDVSIARKNLEDIRNDPFELGSAVKGLTYMSHDRSLSNYAEELVANYAKYSCEQYELSLYDLTDSEQNELARIYIETNGREVNECVYGNDFSINNDFTCALLSMLQNNSAENRENFAEVTRKNTILYFEKTLQEVLDKACNDYLHNMNNEAGYYSHQCRDSGEIYWSKF